MTPNNRILSLCLLVCLAGFPPGDAAATPSTGASVSFALSSGDLSQPYPMISVGLWFQRPCDPLHRYIIDATPLWSKGAGKIGGYQTAVWLERGATLALRGWSFEPYSALGWGYIEKSDVEGVSKRGAVGFRAGVRTSGRMEARRRWSAGVGYRGFPLPGSAAVADHFELTFGALLRR